MLLLGDFNAVKKPLYYILSQRHVSFLINWMIYELHFANLMYDLTFSNTIEFNLKMLLRSHLTQCLKIHCESCKVSLSKKRCFVHRPTCLFGAQKILTRLVLLHSKRTTTIVANSSTNCGTTNL